MPGLSHLAILSHGVFPHKVGGIQKFTYLLARHLAAREIRVDLYYSLRDDAKPNKDHEEIFTADERRFISEVRLEMPKLAYFPGHYLRESYLASRSIFEALKRRPPAEFIFANGFTGWETIKKKNGGMALPPIGVHFHGLEMYQKAADLKSHAQNRMFRPFVRANIVGADAVFSFGGQIDRIVESLGVDRRKLISSDNGIGRAWLNDGREPNERRRELVFIGRYERRKGVNELNAAIQRVESSHEFILHVIGPIPPRHQISSSSVKYWGLLRDEERIKAILRGADVLVCPSYSEGMPTVILEAMASGLAIIATDVGAVSKMVSDRNGWLITTGSVPALENAIRDAITMNAHLLHRKQAASASRVRERFLWESVTTRLVSDIASFVNC